MNIAVKQGKVVPLGVGFYTVPEVARLLKVAPRSINRWLGGYAYEDNDLTKRMPPLWEPELPADEHHIELSFRDLIELRFVKAFLDSGLGLKTIRTCLEYARECVSNDRPFSTRKFLTDGRTIFLESAERTDQPELLDLKRHQFVIKEIIERTFKDLDIENDAVTRWRPYRGKSSIVLDPERSFGQPIVALTGIPTVVVAEAVKAEGSIQRVAHLYEVSVSAIKDAIKFEELLAA